MEKASPATKYDTLKPEEKAAIDHKLQKTLNILENEEGYTVPNAKNWQGKARELFASESEEFIKGLVEDYRRDMAKKNAKADNPHGISKGEEFKGSPPAPPAFGEIPRRNLKK